MSGLLLVGHGTRSRRGIDEFLELAAQIARAAAPKPVEPAFLEMCQPTIRQAVERLLARGAERITVSPLMLFAAGHAKRDIPQAVAAALVELGAERLPIDWAGHLGCHAAILELSARRFMESLHGRAEVPAKETCLLLVGRGSLDETAIAEMHEFARLRALTSPVAAAHVAFLAMAQPAVGEMLPKLAAEGWRRIVVQPHLLFHGELYDSLSAQVAAYQREHPSQEWIVTSYLASDSGSRGPPNEQVTRAVLDRIGEAGIRVVAPSEYG